MYPGYRTTIMTRDGETMAQWGLQPFWAKSKTWGRTNAYNARSETVLEKATWRGPMKNGRCIVPASDFYERSADLTRWLRFSPADGAQFLVAALCEGPNDHCDAVSYALVTTVPNSLVADAHDRMPVMLSPEDAAAWLDPAIPPKELLGLLIPSDPGRMRFEDAGATARNAVAPEAL